MKTKSLAIAVRCVDFSESSQVVTLFTREHGLVEGIAKGAYREKSSFQGPFNLGVLYEVVFIERRSGALSVLTESTVVDGLRGLRAHWGRYLGACHVIELLRVVAAASAPDTLLFDVALETLRRLADAAADRIGLWLARFDALSLRALGLLGSLEACVSCGRVWPGGDRSAFFSTKAGGLVCRQCRESSPHPDLRLSAAEVRALIRLADFEAPLEEVEATWLSGGPRVARILSDLRNYRLERKFLSVEFRRVV